MKNTFRISIENLYVRENLGDAGANGMMDFRKTLC